MSLKRSSVFEIHPWARDLFERLGLCSLEAIVGRFGSHPSVRGKRVTVRPLRLELPDGGWVDIHYKEYAYAPAAWRFAGRRSKAQCEFRNYEALSSVGLRTAMPVAFGEKRTAANRLELAFIITLTVPNAVTMLEFLDPRHNGHPPETMIAQRTSLLRQLADGSRRMHAARFFHNDLVARNLLVTAEPDGNAVLWWIDCPRGRFVRHSPFWQRRQIKDLALLDKSGTMLCTGRERIAFLRRYLDTSLRDPRIKQLARAVTSYAKRRWPVPRAHRLPDRSGPNAKGATVKQPSVTGALP